MKTNTDPLDMVRQGRIRMSHEVDNDPSRLIAALRKREVKYANQIEEYRSHYLHVAEERAQYGCEDR